MPQQKKSNTDVFEQGIHIVNEDKLDPLFQAPYVRLVVVFYNTEG